MLSEKSINRSPVMEEHATMSSYVMDGRPSVHTRIDLVQAGLPMGDGYL